MLVLVAAEHPPLRLALGSDTLARVREKNVFVEQELNTWEAVSRSTDFPV